MLVSTSKRLATDAWFAVGGGSGAPGVRALGCWRWVRAFKARHKSAHARKMAIRTSNFLTRKISKVQFFLHCQAKVPTFFPS